MNTNLLCERGCGELQVYRVCGTYIVFVRDESGEKQLVGRFNSRFDAAIAAKAARHKHRKAGYQAEYRSQADRARGDQGGN